jgi:hypothetical protein
MKTQVAPRQVARDLRALGNLGPTKELEWFAGFLKAQTQELAKARPGAQRDTVLRAGTRTLRRRISKLNAGLGGPRA